MKFCKCIIQDFLVTIGILMMALVRVQAAEPVRLLVPDILQIETLKWAAIATEGFSTTIYTRDCPALDSPRLKGQMRYAVELTIWCQAIKSSGISDRIELVSFPNNKRAFTMLKNGEADGFGNTLFRIKARSKAAIVNHTTAVIAIGDFHVGLFTTKNRKDILQTRTTQNLKKLTGITVTNWAVDFKTMQSLNLALVLDVNRWKLVPRMIEKGRADFTFSYLDQKEMGQEGANLVRIDGLKASLQDERVMMVDRRNDALFEIIQTFISANTAQIRAAFVLSNFITAKYDDWPDVALSGSDNAS
ncbi:MAG: hypothetical protein COB90_08035 [Hyphomicrobiales bacterium]|nr:MAG: hypothetical protein COB90_08035 [Hyphomicrobiales bacterium]